MDRGRGMSIGRKMGLGFGVLLSLMATLALVMLVHIDNMHRQFAYVIEHNAPVIANAKNLLKLVVDMETGQRGFVVTGKQEFLEPYEKALIDFDELIEVEKELVSQNPPQLARLEQIEASVERWKSEAARPEIAMRHKVNRANLDSQRLDTILANGKGDQLCEQMLEIGHEIETSFVDIEDWEGAFVIELIEKCIADRADSQRGFLITGKPEFLDKYENGEHKNLSEFFTRLRDHVNDRGMQGELIDLVDQMERISAVWVETAAEPAIDARRVMNKHPEKLQDVAAMLEAGSGKTILDNIREDFRQFIDVENDLMEHRFAAATRTADTATRMTIMLTMVSLVIGGCMALVITQGITKPVQDLATALVSVAKGDLNQSIEVDASDEIGELSTSFNQMVSDLKQLNQSREEGEQALRSAKEFTDNIIGSMTDMLVVVAPDGSIVSTNKATAQRLGYQEQELVGESVSLLFPSVECEQHSDTGDGTLSLLQRELPLPRNILESLAKDGAFNNFELSLQSRDRQSIPALLSGALMWDKPDEIRGVVCVARDISEHKKTEKALCELEIRSRALLDGSPVCNKIIDLDSRLLYMSAAGVEQLKIDDIESLYGNVYPPEIYPEELRAPLIEHLERAKAGECCSVECPVTDTEGSKVWYHTTFVPVRDDEGRMLYIIASSVDITERKRAEEEAEDLQAQLRHAQKMDAIGQLATGVAHEFNNVLVGVRGNAELLLNMSAEQLSDDVRRPLKDIERSAARAYEITQQLLSFARKKKHHVTLFDINHVVADSKQMLQRLIGTQITLKTHLIDQQALVRADQSEVEQALMNLVINARDAMPDGGELTITTSVQDLEQDAVPQHCAAGHFVQLSVADNGCGMSSETVERIFEPFFTTKSIGKGTGLGLSTVYSDIVNSDGFVSVDSDQGDGTAITIHLPLSNSALGEVGEPSKPALQPARGGETILICDDEDIVLTSMTALLKSAGYAVIAANGAHQALDAADEHNDQISLLITDLTMPEMDGVELAKQMRSRHPHIKIIYSSGYAANYVELCAEKDGVQIIEKGRSSDEMFQRIRQVLDADDAAANQPLREAG